MRLRWALPLLLVLAGCGLVGGKTLTVDSECSFKVDPSGRVDQWSQTCPNGQWFPADNGNPLTVVGTMAEESKSITIFVVGEGFVSVEGEHLLDWDVSGNLLVLVIDRDALPLGANTPLDFNFGDETYVCDVGASIVVAACD